ncbi:MAG: helix-turn-helix transcriptional regulator [Blautia sp.]|nr:helix-turn-helix transcriptional regulator [Blautia sp.]
MRYAAEEVEKRLWLLSGQLYSGNGLGAWCFSLEQKLFYSTEPHWEEFQVFLQISGILDKITSEESEDPEPTVYTDDLGLVWIAERTNLKNQGVFFIVCGPAYIKGHSRKDVLKKLSMLNLSVSLRIRYATALSELPVLGNELTGYISRMLHFTLYDEYLPFGFIRFADYKDHDSEESLSVDETDISALYSSENDEERNAILQKTLLDAVRIGKFDNAPENGGERYYGELQDYGIPDELRTIKNNLIIFLSRCSDAAVEGGLPLRTAKEKQNQAIREVEQSRSVADAVNANWKAFLDFVRAVHTSRQAADTGISRPVQQVMDYIQNNYRKPVELSELAKQAGYSEYYLSRKFTKETGMKIQDYLKQTRIHVAKVMLITSKKSIFQIAEECQFKSRSHFDKTFTQLVGMSPAQYRETMGSQRKSDG